jgi:eukaryotic-like serine/threonine-protein kinase
VAFGKEGFKGSTGDIWVLDLKRNSTTRLTFGPGSNVYPVWSPDGSQIVFSSNRDGNYELYRKPADGARAEQLLLRTKDRKRAMSWSRDGRYLLFGTSRNLADEQLWVLPMQGEPNPISFSHSQFDEGAGKFSPDGRWIAYLSNETGQYEVYVREFTGAGGSTETGGKWMISKNGGFYPIWRADGKEIAYLSLDRNFMMSVSVDSGRTFRAGTPRQLIRIPTDRGGFNEVATTPDLKRFLMPVALEEKVSQSFTVMLNWTSALKK